MALEADIFAVEVVVIDESALAFYVKYGFVPLLDAARHLYSPIKTIGALVKP